jgi:hypothetical protein
VNFINGKMRNFNLIEMYIAFFLLRAWATFLGTDEEPQKSWTLLLYCRIIVLPRTTISTFVTPCIENGKGSHRSWASPFSLLDIQLALLSELINIDRRLLLRPQTYSA